MKVLIAAPADDSERRILLTKLAYLMRLVMGFRKDGREPNHDH